MPFRYVFAEFFPGTIPSGKPSPLQRAGFKPKSAYPAQDLAYSKCSINRCHLQDSKRRISVHPSCSRPHMRVCAHPLPTPSSGDIITLMMQVFLAPIIRSGPSWLCPAQLGVKLITSWNILLNLILRTHQSIIEPVTPYYNQIKNQQQSSFIQYHMPYKVIINAFFPQLSSYLQLFRYFSLEITSSKERY